MIKFNKPFSQIQLEGNNLRSLSGDGFFTRQVRSLFKEKCYINNLLLTTSCTHALEMSTLLLNIKEGDEIIAPSFTFVSTVNEFVLRGAKIVFVDVEKDTMNIDASLIEAAITEKTKAIVVVHYAGVACDMYKIMSIAERHSVFVV